MKQFTIALSFNLMAGAAFADHILADTPPMFAIASALILDSTQTEIEMAIDANQSIHHFALKPSQARKITDASHLVTIGAELFPQINTAFENLNPEVDVISIESLLNHDPHFWMSPETVIAAAKLIDQKLPNSDPSGERFQQFEQRITSIDAQISEIEFERGVIVGHNAFAGFISQYNIPYFGAFTDLHELPVSPKERQEIEAAITNGDVNCLILDKSEPSPELEKFAMDSEIDYVYVDVLGWDLTQPNTDQFFEKFYDDLGQAFSNCALS